MWLSTLQVHMYEATHCPQVHMLQIHVPVEAEINLRCHSSGAVHYFVGVVLFLKQISH